MAQEDITVPRWFLENIENTLRIQNNINLDKRTGETCQDRNIKEALNGVRKLLKGEELTGMERLETQVEKKTVKWSKEDIEKIDLLDAMCDDMLTKCTSYSTMHRVVQEIKQWLKSLKYR